MSEYLVKLGFWLRAYDSVTIEAVSDAEAVEEAKAAATALMDSRAQPEAIDTDERWEGVIAFIDRISRVSAKRSPRMSRSTTTASMPSCQTRRTSKTSMMLTAGLGNGPGKAWTLTERFCAASGEEEGGRE